MAHEEDLHVFLESNVTFCRRLDDELRSRIIPTIISRADGMSLLASVEMEKIMTLRTKSKILQALRTIGRGLGHLYEETLDRMKSQEGEDSVTALRLLKWVSFAKSPMHVHEV